jgi:hypothetical protein
MLHVTIVIIAIAIPYSLASCLIRFPFLRTCIPFNSRCFMHYPQCTTLPVRTRKYRSQQRHFRDLTLTPARITDITLSRMTLGKCRLLLRHFRDVTLTPARIADITLSRLTLGKCRLLQRDVTLTPSRITDIKLWRKCLAPAAMLCLGF